jgi:DNA-binding NarL/FixJ family response regulator
MVRTMKAPIFVRSFSEEERESLEASLRSRDTFTLRRAQMLLASSRGDEVPQIAENLGCGQQTVRDAIHDFDARGLGALKAGSL